MYTSALPVAWDSFMSLDTDSFVSRDNKNGAVLNESLASGGWAASCPDRDFKLARPIGIDGLLRCALGRPADDLERLFGNLERTAGVGEVVRHLKQGLLG